MDGGKPIIFFVAGEPKGQPRARAFALKRGGQTFVRMYDASTAEGWKSQIAQAATAHVPFPVPLGPVSLDLEFIFRRPKSHYRTGRHAGELRPDAPYWHVGKPDRDNLEKAVMDAFTTLGFFKDDSQVCTGTKPVSKIYGGRPGCLVRIEYLSQDSVFERLHVRKEAVL